MSKMSKNIETISYKKMEIKNKKNKKVDFFRHFRHLANWV